MVSSFFMNFPRNKGEISPGRKFIKYENLSTGIYETAFFAKTEVLIFYVSLLGVFGESLERNQREMFEKPTVKF